MNPRFARLHLRVMRDVGRKIRDLEEVANGDRENLQRLPAADFGPEIFCGLSWSSAV